MTTPVQARIQEQMKRVFTRGSEDTESESDYDDSYLDKTQFEEVKRPRRGSVLEQLGSN